MCFSAVQVEKVFLTSKPSFNLREFTNIWHLNREVRAIYASILRSKVFGHLTGRLENVQSDFITFRGLSGNANGALVTGSKKISIPVETSIN